MNEQEITIFSARIPKHLNDALEADAKASCRSKMAQLVWILQERYGTEEQQTESAKAA
ncbi:MAG: hypothetical protein ACO24O_07175 [Arenimonas sp.]